MVGSLQNTRLLTVQSVGIFGLLALLSLTAALACSPPPFVAARQPVRRALDGSAEPTVTKPTLENFALEHIATFTTYSNTPSPAFDSEGKWLVFHSNTDQHSTDYYTQRPAEVHAVDLVAMEESVVYEFPSPSSTPAVNTDYGYGYDPYYGEGGYGYGYIAGYDTTYHPVMLADGTLLVSQSMISSAPVTSRVGRGSSTAQTFGPAGGQPSVSPTGERILLQTLNEVIEVDLQGNTKQSYPGFFGVWAPDGKSFLGHLTPYVTSEFYGSYPDWPEGIEPTYGNAGGLYLAKDGELKQVTTSGGRPTWHPSGHSFVYERLAGQLWGGYEAPPTALAEVNLDNGLEHIVAETGSQPVYHPSGALLLYSTPQGLELTDFKSQRPLQIDGQEPAFSPRGDLLVVTTQSKLKHHGLVRDVVLYAVKTAK